MDMKELLDKSKIGDMVAFKDAEKEKIGIIKDFLIGFSSITFVIDNEGKRYEIPITPSNDGKVRLL